MKDRKYFIFNKKHYIEDKNVIESNYVGKKHGQSSSDFTCPFCNTTTKAYIFSISGGGKKCDYCPDTLIQRGSAWKKFKTKEAAEEFLNATP